MTEDHDDARHSAAWLDAEHETIRRELNEVDRQAAATLREALFGFVGAVPPDQAMHDAANTIRNGLKKRRPLHRNIAAGAGWRRKAPKDDRRCCIEAAGSLMKMSRGTGLTGDDEAMLLALEHDWLGAIIGLVRAGPGASADGSRLVAYVDACPEVQGTVDPGDAPLMASAFDLVLGTWETAGAIDQDHRLTPLGVWTLPRALACSWGIDFDTGESIRG